MIYNLELLCMFNTIRNSNGSIWILVKMVNFFEKNLIERDSYGMEEGFDYKEKRIRESTKVE